MKEPRNKRTSVRTEDNDSTVDKNAESASKVAGQIAHDFNNLLTPLLAYPDLIRKDLPPKCRGRDLLDIVEKTALDMARISQQLLALSGRGQLAQTSININDVAARVISLLSNSAETRDVEFVADLESSLLPVNAAPEQLLRAVQNLCQNALDAVERSGRIVVKTENTYVDAPTGHQNKVKVGEYVKLSVTDNGTGVPPGIAEKMFEPFFTTKRTSQKRGTGLGLSVVRGIVRDHGGTIDVTSAPGKGTTFDLYLPVARDALTEVAATEPVHSGETVLVVDDDAVQRDVITELFRLRGYLVTGKPNGESAVEHIARCADTDSKGPGPTQRLPDIVILDVVLGAGMDGKEACKRILEINPRQRIVMVSGYPAADEAGVAAQTSTVTYLSKPLTWGRLHGALRSLDKHEQEPEATDGQVPRDKNHVMIADDEEGIRKLFQMILSSAFPKARIELVCNGAEAVDAFCARHHAIVLMDLRMPIMDGKTSFQKIKEVCSTRNWELPSVVFCTGFAPPSSVQDIVDTSSKHSLLTKPVSGDDLVSAIRERLAKQ